MQEKTKNIKGSKDRPKRPKKEEEKESCKFLFDMIGRVFSK